MLFERGDGDDHAIANAARTKEIEDPTGYNADADWNRDGEVTSTDVAAFGSTHHAGAIPAGLVAPRTSELTVGFCGYRFNPDIGAYTVRFRHYAPTPGMARWLERDPAGYVDGPSLYAYLGRSPVDGVDPSGLQDSDDDLYYRDLDDGGLPALPEGTGSAIKNGAYDALVAVGDVSAATLQTPVNLAWYAGSACAGNATWLPPFTVWFRQLWGDDTVDMSSGGYATGAIFGSAAVFVASAGVAGPAASGGAAASSSRGFTLALSMTSGCTLSATAATAAAAATGVSAAAHGYSYGVRWYNASTGESGYYSVGSGGASPDPLTLRKLSTKQAKSLGVDPHEVKQDYGFGPPSRNDLWRDRDGNIYVMPKNPTRLTEPQPTPFKLGKECD